MDVAGKDDVHKGDIDDEAWGFEKGFRLFFYYYMIYVSAMRDTS